MENDIKNIVDFFPIYSVIFRFICVEYIIITINIRINVVKKPSKLGIWDIPANGWSGLLSNEIDTYLMNWKIEFIWNYGCLDKNRNKLNNSDEKIT